MNDPDDEPTDHDQRPSDPFAEWQRLDARSVLASTGMLLVPLVPVMVLVLLSADAPWHTLQTASIWPVLVVLGLGSAWWRWLFTRFRVTPERFELRQGNLSRSFHSIPRERIRSVDLTAPVPHRLLGLAVVRIGTGRKSTGGSELRLDALPTSRAERLRGQLLRQRRETSARQAPSQRRSSGPDGGVELARMHPSWYLHSTLTASLLLVTWAALGSALNTLGDLLRAVGFTSLALDRVLENTDSVLTGQAPWLGVFAVLLVLLVGGWLGALAISLEMWWGYRLSAEDGGTLHVRRGLLTTRAVSLEKRRLRGIELAEPLLLRLAGGGRLTAVATGLGNGASGRSDNKALLPPAPRSTAERVGAAALERTDGSALSVKLRRHPPAALRRRLVRAMLGVLVLVGATSVAAVLLDPIPWWSSLVALLGAVPAVALALDSHRNLGHGLHDDFLVARHGAGVRRTVLLQRNAVIGWRVSQSPFQRLAGLVTLSATTAAGNGYYSIHDVDASTGPAFADEAVPGLLPPFLCGDPTDEGSGQRRNGDDTSADR